MALKSRYSLLTQFNMQNLSSTVLTLSARERMIALGVAAGIVVLLTFLPVSLLSGKISSLQEEVGSSQEVLREIGVGVEKYNSLKGEMDRLETGLGKGIPSLTTTIESIAGKTEIRSNLESLKERPLVESDFLEGQAVSLKLSKVTLDQLVSFLYNVENNPTGFMKVVRIDIRPVYSSRSLMDVTCEIASLTIKKEI